VAYQWANGMTFDAIFLASSSGGTQAGLEVGKRLFGYPDMKIIGISPDNSSEGIKSSMASIMKPMMNRLKMNSTVSMEELQVDDGYIGKGYGLPSAASLQATKMFFQTEGILLDRFTPAKRLRGSSITARNSALARRPTCSSGTRAVCWRCFGRLAVGSTLCYS
jgi:D-cysteine desulfhydrase